MIQTCPTKRKVFNATFNTLKFQPVVLTLFALLTLQLFGCGPNLINIHDRDEAAPSAVVVTGRIEVTDLPKRRIGEWRDLFGRLHPGQVPAFRVTISIESLDKKDFKAGHRVGSSHPKDFFYWYLPPGRYEIQALKYYAEVVSGIYTYHVSGLLKVWATFSVPKNVPAVYIGSVVMSAKTPDRIIRNLDILDESSEAKIAYNERFQPSGVLLHKNLMSWSPPR